MYQESHQQLEGVSEILVQASDVTGAFRGVSKCVEMVFEHGMMIKDERLKVFEEGLMAFAQI